MKTIPYTFELFLEQLKAHVEEGYVTARKHPYAPFTIYNYTAKVQYEKHWNGVTKTCRGIIISDDGEIVARPFQKFFNFGEHQGSLPDGEPDVLEKLDGSLGILYWWEGKPFIASRGSFESEQAAMGTKILHEKYKDVWDTLDKSKTYLFEIIYPENRIVVDYGDECDLFLLAIIDTESGAELPLIEGHYAFRTAGRHPAFKLGEVDLAGFDTENREGFVFRWPNGLRLKVKFDEYTRLHRLLTNTTARSIWDILRTGQPMTELLERVPDEFYGWVKAKSREFSLKYEEVHSYVKNTVKSARANVSIPSPFDKDEPVTAEKIKALTGKYRNILREEFKQKPEYEHLCWAMFDHMDQNKLRDLVFETFYPAHEKPFKTDDL